MKITVLDADTLGFKADAWREVARLGELTLHPATGRTNDEILANIGAADVILTNKVPLSQDVLARLDQVKLISVLATGYNIIDLAAAQSQGVTVCNVPAYSSSSVAQHTVALILELCNNCGLHSETVHRGDWCNSKHFCYWVKPVIELTGLTVGMMGFGDIGRKTATILHAMGARIQACVRTPRNTPDWEGFRWVDRDELFASSDIVSLHCPQSPDTEGLVDTDRIASMRKGAMLVNTARGGLVDESAIAAALHSGQLSAVALDVVSAEPMQGNNPLLGAPNCIITPHIAWSSEQSRRRLLDVTVNNLQAFLAGSPQNTVSK
tara:strand:+ start:96 stop:1061 length:966 start_codon:yes stop_codon:yes gene_type:complete